MRKLASYLLLGAAVLAPAATAHAQACSRVATLNRYDLTDAVGVLARALSDTRYRLDNASGIFDNTVRDIPVCLDSVPFLASWTREQQPRIEIAPVDVAVITNSAYPRGMNDGVLWAGKGFNSTVSAGARG
ncbi:MAG TPA: hypothetical protein VF021_05750, partial [Longimicrobiales bacterium]